MATNTYSRRRVAVTETRKSHATVMTDVLQVVLPCPGRPIANRAYIDNQVGNLPHSGLKYHGAMSVLQEYQDKRHSLQTDLSQAQSRQSAMLAVLGAAIAAFLIFWNSPFWFLLLLFPSPDSLYAVTFVPAAVGAVGASGPLLRSRVGSHKRDLAREGLVRRRIRQARPSLRAGPGHSRRRIAVRAALHGANGTGPAQPRRLSAGPSRSARERFADRKP